MEVDRPNLEAAVSAGTAHTTGIAAAAAAFLRHVGCWRHAVTLHRIAATSVHAGSDRLGQADALTGLSSLQRATGDYRVAMTTLTTAVQLYRRLGDRGGEAWALNNYAAAVAETRSPAQARTLHTDALHMAREIPISARRGDALDGIAATYRREGNTPLAEAFSRQALDLYRSIGCATQVVRVEANLNHTENDSPDAVGSITRSTPIRQPNIVDH